MRSPDAHSARIPMLPALSLADTSMLGDRGDTPFLGWKNAAFFCSGRVALARALAELDVRRNSEVLLPAYHCRTMVDPVHWLGAHPVFYRLHPDLMPDLDDITEKLGPQVRAVVCVHYFGGIRDFSGVREICRDQSVSLIEDGAHVLSREPMNEGFGTYGDLVIGSPRKFFPIQDGGLLFSRRLSLAEVHPAALGIKHELKVALNTLEYSYSHGRLRAPGLLASLIGRTRARNRRHPGVEGESIGEDLVSDRSGAESVRRWANPLSRMNGSMSAVSKSILRSASLERAMAKRRRNYDALKGSLSSLSLGTEVTDEVCRPEVPYVFLMEIREAARTHAQLKARNVPVWRWDSLAAAICATSNRLSQTLIQLPCHQGLTDDELDCLIDRVKMVLR